MGDYHTEDLIWISFLSTSVWSNGAAISKDQRGCGSYPNRNGEGWLEVHQEEGVKFG